MSLPKIFDVEFLIKLGFPLTNNSGDIYELSTATASSTDEEFHIKSYFKEQATENTTTATTTTTHANTETLLKHHLAPSYLLYQRSEPVKQVELIASDAKQNPTVTEKYSEPISVVFPEVDKTVPESDTSSVLKHLEESIRCPKGYGTFMPGESVCPYGFKSGEVLTIVETSLDPFSLSDYY